MTSGLVTTAAGLVALDVPVDPDADQARSWLEAELLDPIYHEQPNLLSTVWQWLAEQLSKVGQAATPSSVALIVVSGIALVALVAFLVAGPVARSRRVARESRVVLVDDSRTAAQLRADADAHAAAGRWAEAVLDRFRAILRSLEERAVLDPRPGRTADEAASDAAARLPDLTTDLLAAGRLFDEVCYGDRVPDAEAARWLAELDGRVVRTRPSTPEPVAVG